MELYEQGRDYWIIARRYHANRFAPLMRPTAINDMLKLKARERSPAVLRRVNNFIAKHQSPPPGVTPIGTGPRRA